MNFLGWILLLLGVAIWWTGRMIGRLIVFIFSAIWWLVCLPFRAIYWVFSEGTDFLGALLSAILDQWDRDKSIFFAKMFITLLVILFCFKAVGFIHILFAGK